MLICIINKPRYYSHMQYKQIQGIFVKKFQMLFKWRIYKWNIVDFSYLFSYLFSNLF